MASITRIAREIKDARDQLSALEDTGEFEDCDTSVQFDMLSLVQKLDAWATALELVGVER